MVVIPLGSRVKVFWTGERRWFFGVVDQTRREDGKRIHHVTYEDGDKKWHHLASESWLHVEDVEEPGKAERVAAKATTRAPRRGRSSGFVAASPYP